MDMQGGKTKQPILREDVLLQRMPRVKAKQSEMPDAFAPEYSQETWLGKLHGKGHQQCDQVQSACLHGVACLHWSSSCSDPPEMPCNCSACASVKFHPEQDG